MHGGQHAFHLARVRMCYITNTNVSLRVNRGPEYVDAVNTTTRDRRGFGADMTRLAISTRDDANSPRRTVYYYYYYGICLQPEFLLHIPFPKLFQLHILLDQSHAIDFY